jgi:hypothetical protein
MEGKIAYTHTRTKINGSQRTDFKVGTWGSTNAMVPGRKHGTYCTIDSRSSGKVPAIHRWTMATSTEIVHKMTSLRRAVLCPRIHRNRNGRKIYICTSYGSDHSTFRIDPGLTRFWTSNRFDRIRPSGIVLARERLVPGVQVQRHCSQDSKYAERVNSKEAANLEILRKLSPVEVTTLHRIHEDQAGVDEEKRRTPNVPIVGVPIPSFWGL